MILFLATFFTEFIFVYYIGVAYSKGKIMLSSDKI